MKPLLLIQLIVWASLSLCHGQIVINEIHFDPLEAQLNDEFVELYNAGDETVDVSDWRLSGAVAFTIPQGTAPLEPGGFLVVALDPASALFEGIDVLGPWEGRIDGDGERAVLRDASGASVDEVDFEVRFPWPIAAAGDGPSMELLNPGMGNNLGSSWRPSKGDATPGKENSVFADNPPPNIRQFKHSPKEPKPDEEVTITIKITDTDGVQNVVLHYLIVEPGNYIPAYSPFSRSALLADPAAERRLSAGYAEGLFTGRWPTLPMEAIDPDGTDEDLSNDGVFTVTLPGQMNRTLVRAYITAEDGSGQEVRAPLKDDPSLNFAYFVYAGVPDWVASEDSSQGNGHVYKADLLQKLPTYHLLVRNEDWLECLAYEGRDQHPRSSMSARSAYNWSGTIIYDGQVYDNIAFRLRGGNGRYQERGKRSMKFKFNRGYHFAVKDNRGRPYEFKWRVLTISKMYGNRLGSNTVFGSRRGPGNFGIVDTVNGRLWELFGVPAVRTHWFHFRVVDDAAEAPDQYGGDFYGMGLAQERIDVRFLESRGLPKGNLYKLTDQSENFNGVGGKGSASDGKKQQRYQAPNAPLNADDYTNIFSQLRAARDDDWLRKHVNWDIWNRYTAVEEAIRHYDYWPDADKNMVQYFEPMSDNPLGRYWQLPYDSDASWGPSWNGGIDYAQNAIRGNDNFQIELRNVMREFRGLVWQPDVIGNLIDDAAKVIEDFHPADWDRWRDAPRATGSEDFGTLASKVADMKLFAFEGDLSYPGGNVGAGGRAKVLDDMAEDSSIPKTPEITFTGTSGNAIDALTYSSSAYKASSIFTPSELAKVEWRIGEITDPEAPAYDPEAERKYEITQVWHTEMPSDLAMAVPANVLKVGHTYRTRVRHWDITGRASSWSSPHEFTAEAPLAGAALQDSLVLSEIMYHPSPASEAETAAGFDEADFEFIEVWNRGTTTLDLTDVRFTKGIDFDFPAGTSIASSGYALLVSNKAAMGARYGADLPILGEWPANFSLSNGGERLKLSFGAGNAIVDFRYDDAEPWPTSTDGEGFSLVAGMPETITGEAYNDASSWRASLTMGGSPGAAEADGGPDPEPSEFADWLASRGFSDPNADPDQDGITHFGAYAMAIDLLGDGETSSMALPSLESDTNTLRVRRRASGVIAALEWSDNLQTWTTSEAAPPAPIANADSSVTLTFPLGQERDRYWRIRFSEAP